MNYTDKQLLISSQIAYYDINDNIIREVNEWYEDDMSLDNSDINIEYTLSDIFTYSDTFRNSIYTSVRKSLGLSDDEDISTRAKALKYADDAAAKVNINYIYNIIDELQKDEEGSIGSWKLVSYVFNDDIGVKGVAGKLVDGAWVTDDEFSSSGDGLCAYVFETSEDSAIVAFRGSEPITSWKTLFSDDFKSDWISADGGLALNDEDTLQQQSVYQYINNYVNSLGYDNYAFAA